MPQLITGSMIRKQLWEVNEHWLCSICGTCLSMEEQRQLLRKLDMEEASYLDYEIHSLMVQNSAFANRLSYHINKLLNQKYHYDIAQYGCLGEEEFDELWKEKYAQGDICGLYWVALTRRDLSLKFVHRLFCDIHMLSHLNGGSNRREKAECQRLEKHNKQLQEKIRRERKLRKEMESKLADSEKRNKELNNKYIKLEKLKLEHPAEIGAGQASVGLETNAEMDSLQTELLRALRIIEELDRDKSALSRELSSQQKINQQLYEEFQRILKDMAAVPGVCPKSGEEMSQCRRRVLLVGGLTRLSSLYRELAEEMGFDFDYHDGYMNAGEKGLKNLIQKVDLVLCSTDANSHGACNSVKKLCKNLNKDCCFLNNTSLSSISRTLQGVTHTYQETGPELM